MDNKFNKILEKLTLAKNNLSKLENISAEPIVSGNLQEINRFSNQSELSNLTSAKDNLLKLRNLSGTEDLQTLVITTQKIEANNIPQRWCPVISNLIKFEDLPTIYSSKIFNIDGGTP
jgi:hypothetical protein